MSRAGLPRSVREFEEATVVGVQADMKRQSVPGMCSETKSICCPCLFLFKHCLLYTRWNPSPFLWSSLYVFRNK